MNRFLWNPLSVEPALSGRLLSNGHPAIPRGWPRKVIQVRLLLNVRFGPTTVQEARWRDSSICSGVALCEKGSQIVEPWRIMVEKNKEKFTGSHTEVNPSFYISGVPSEVFEIPATLSAIIHVFILWLTVRMSKWLVHWPEITRGHGTSCL